MTQDDKQAAVERFGMRGMTLASLNWLVAEHHDQDTLASRVIVQAAKEEIFVKRAIGAE